jgi:hypothetical protein
MDPVTASVVTVWVTRPVLWSAGTGVIQYPPFNGLVWACDVASMDIMLMMKSALMHMTRGFEIFFVCTECIVFPKMFVFNFLSLPEFWNLLRLDQFYRFLQSELTLIVNCALHGN